MFICLDNNFISHKYIYNCVEVSNCSKLVIMKDYNMINPLLPRGCKRTGLLCTRTYSLHTSVHDGENYPNMLTVVSCIM